MTKTLSSTYTLYSTSTCTRCPLAKRSMERAGVRYRTVQLDLPENESVIEDLKDEMNASVLSVPIVRKPDGGILSNLAYISQHFMEVKGNED